MGIVYQPNWDLPVLEGIIRVIITGVCPPLCVLLDFRGLPGELGEGE